MTMTEKNEELIVEAREQAAYLRGVSRDGSMPYSGELLESLADALEAAEARLAALTTGQEIDAPSVREAIGEVLADMGAVIDGVPVASDLVALTEIADAAIQAATSPPSRTAKRTGYETVASAVGEHSQKITARAALTTPQEVHPLTEATVALARSIHGPEADHEDFDYYRKHVEIALDAADRVKSHPSAPQGGDARERAAQVALAHVPVIGVTGGIVGCRCMDRVFVQHQETWSEHIADAILAAFPALSRAAAPEAATEQDECALPGHAGCARVMVGGEPWFDHLPAERDAALAAIERIRQAVSGHPECDRYEEGDVISCGWKSAYASVVAALDGAPEPEWEWALQASGDDEPWSQWYESRELLAENLDGLAARDDEHLVRRRKAGPWLPVEGESNGY